MITIERYDPRKDREDLKELFEDFIKNKSYFDSNWSKFDYELNKRSLNLQYRNSMVIAKEDGKIVGWGTYTIFRDYLGNDRVLIHQILTRKDDAYKKGIEEMLIRELLNYISSTLGINKFNIICPDSDGNLRSLLLKLGLKKSQFIWYEKELG
ncbi:MAG: GNAT family N-acetyltransferase [Candidatus Hodarchaeota archaeon]